MEWIKPNDTVCYCGGQIQQLGGFTHRDGKQVEIPPWKEPLKENTEGIVKEVKHTNAFRYFDRDEGEYVTTPEEDYAVVDWGDNRIRLIHKEDENNTWSRKCPCPINKKDELSHEP